LSDYYLNDLELAIFNYQTFINKFPDHFYTETVKKRLDDMRKNIENTKNISEQALAYNLAINYLISDFNYDSVIVLLKEIKKGPSQIYIDASTKAEMAIDKYLELNKIIKDIENDSNIDSLLTESNSALNKFKNLDSLYFTMAQLFSEDFQIDDSSILFHKHIVSTFKDSKYRSESILYLQDKDSSEVWSEVLITDNNSILDLDSTIIVPLYLDEVFSLDYINKEQANIQKYDEYLNIFSDSLNFNMIEPIDSIQISNQSISTDSSISPTIQSKKLDLLK
tara:strand:- start:1623 stop:2462 length:840 start_codon:yes stop_codon:yes gene_type:complete